MPLRSNLFKDSMRLQKCLVNHAAHVAPGSVGKHVGLIQIAVEDLAGLAIDAAELKAQKYGPSTTAALLQFKRKRKIINFSYETNEDNIVGKMTIAALDNELFRKQYVPPPGSGKCLISGKN